MRFGPLQLNYFNADEGAYSIVTDDERNKGQITLTESDGESAIAIRALGEGNIPRQAAQSRPVRIRVRRLDGTEQSADLTVNFPKATRNELRIYRKAAEGFGYEAGDVWFVFRRARRLFVGAMSESAWRAIGRQDPEDDRYVDLVAGEPTDPAVPRRGSSLQYPRDPALARRRFQLAGYRCEFNPDHELFVARASRRPFLEPHHLVPVSLQAQFSTQNLDRIDNIFALCPWCHRAVHHAEPRLVSEVITTLLDRRAAVCGRLNLAPADILRLYNCERITR